MKGKTLQLVVSHDQPPPSIPKILGMAKTRRNIYTPHLDFAQHCEKARKESMRSAAAFKEVKFLRAAVMWLREKSLHTDKPGTLECYRDYILRLWAFFKYQPPVPPHQQFTLADVHIGHFIEYQKQKRCPQNPCTTCYSLRQHYHPASVNHDLNTLAQILRRAGLWQPIAEHYQPLPVPKKKKPRVLTEEAKAKFFALGASEPAWEGAYLEALTGTNTTAYGVELRLLTHDDVEMTTDPPTISVPLDVKNDYRPRVIPLNEEARIAMERILERARLRGSYLPHHYVFPFRIKRNQWDPTRPASPSWTNYQWNGWVARALELGVIPFRISRRNFRNQAITEMLEGGASLETVRSVAGHIDEETTRWYDQHRIAAKAAALELLSPSRKKSSSPYVPKRRIQQDEVGA